MAMPVSVMARADARAGGGEGVYRHPSPGHDDGPVYGPRRQLVGAARQGLATSAMRDGVWDRTASHQSEYKEYSALRRDDGGTGRHLTTFRSGLGLRSIRSQRSNRY